MINTIETFTAAAGDTFTRGTYNGIAVLVRDKDGYINASKLGNNSRPARHFIKSNRFQQICQHWSNRHQDSSPQYSLTQIDNEFKGVYVHPDLIHFVAEWVDIEYAFTVADIMNSINDKVHDALEKQHLPDTVENAKPVFNEIAKQISIKIDIDLVNSRCWGVRDDVHKLDSYERDDLKRAIDDYNSIKKQLGRYPRDRKLLKALNDAHTKLDEWKYFIPTYHPEFQY